jgi:hypothetical protein
VDVRARAENQPEITTTRNRLNDALATWWETARNDFSELAPQPDASALAQGAAPTVIRNDARLPKVRATLLNQLVQLLVPLGVLDDYQSRGVFVNWWEGIKYDLKTITSIGWAPTLIPEPMVIDRFFSPEGLQLGHSDSLCTTGARLNIKSVRIHPFRPALDLEVEHAVRLHDQRLQGEILADDSRSLYVDPPALQRAAVVRLDGGYFKRIGCLRKPRPHTQPKHRYYLQSCHGTIPSFRLPGNAARVTKNVRQDRSMRLLRWPNPRK